MDAASSSNKDVVVSSTKSARERLQNAIDDFKATLTENQRRDLDRINKEHYAASICQFTAQLDSSKSRRKSRAVASRLSKLMEALLSFCGVIETFVSSDPTIAGLIWGSVKLTLQIIVNYTTYFFNKASELFVEFGRLCPLFDDYAKLYPDSKSIQDSLWDFHASLIRCCRHIIEAMRRPWYQKLGQAFLHGFDEEFRPDQEETRRCSDIVKESIELAKTRAEVEHHKETSKGMKKVKDLVLRVKHGNKEVRQQLSRQDDFNARDRKYQLLKELCGHDPKKSLRRNQRKRFGNTANWIFETSEFCDWINGKSPPLLWFSGKIGSGKSVIAARVVDYFFEKGPLDCLVYYVFVQSGDQASMSASTLLRSILKQILTSWTHLSAETEEKIRGLLDEDDLDDVVELILNYLRTSKPTYIIVDGLDECERPERLRVLKSLSSLANSTANTKLFLSSRDNISDDIQSSFSSMGQLTINDSNIKDDIANYIDGIVEEKVDKFAVGDPSLIDEIKKALTAGADGMFLWVYFQMEEVMAQPCDEDIRHTLATLPKNLEETFRRLVDRIRLQGNEKIARDIFPWLAVSTRPLKLDELREAIAVEIGRREIKPGRLYNKMDGIASRCENLVQVDEEDRSIQFAHHSIKEFFLRRESTKLDSDFSIDIEETNHFIGEVCVTYLHLDVLNRSLIQRPDSNRMITYVNPLAQPTSNPVVSTVQKLLPQNLSRPIDFDSSFGSSTRKSGHTSPHPFLEYASTNWIFHTKDFEQSKSKTWNLWKNIVVSGHDLADTPWHPITWDNGMMGICDWAQQEKHYALLHLLFLTRKDTRQMAERLTNTAVKNRDRALLDIMLLHQSPSHILGVSLPVGEKQAGMRTYGTNLNTALRLASEEGRQDLVEMLLLAGAHVNAPNSDGMTAIALASGKGHFPVVNMLLEARADINADQAWGKSRTALQAAAEGGHHRVVEKLLEAHANVDALGAHENGRTALQAAARKGHLDLIGKLLAAGVDVNAIDDGGRTALQEAMESGCLGAVERLLAAGADVNATDDRGRTALHLSATESYREIVRSLLEAGSNVKAINRKGRIALILAAEENTRETVKILLEAGANVNAISRKGKTALHLAAEDNSRETVKILLEAGANVNAINRKGRTALHRAAIKGHLAIVKKLLEAGADVNVTDNQDQTAFYLAVKKGHLDIVKKLIAVGANVNATRGWHGTALHIAAGKGHLAIVKKLLEAGTDVNVTDREGQTALHIAAAKGHLDIVKKLLEAGTDVNAIDDENETALDLALESRHQDVVGRLRRAGAKG